MVFQKREIPENIPELEIPPGMLNSDETDLVKLLSMAGFVSSNSEARRLIDQGAVKVNGNKINSLKISGLRDGDVIQAGKHKFIKLKINNTLVGEAIPLN